MPKNGGTPSSMPHSRATATTRSIARPRMQTCRPAAKTGLGRGAQAGDVGGEGRHDHPALRLGDEPGKRLGDVALRRAFAFAQDVGRIQQTSASTPSSPSALRRASSVGRPTIGVGSIFQSAVWTTSPAGVRIASAVLSGIEWATAMNSTSKRADRDRLALADDPGSGSWARPARRAGEPRRARPRSASYRRARRASGQSSASAPMWSSCAWVMTMPTKILLRLLDKAEIGHDEIDARQVLASKGDAEIDHQPFARASAARSHRARNSCRFRRGRQAVRIRIRCHPPSRFGLPARAKRTSPRQAGRPMRAISRDRRPRPLSIPLFPRNSKRPSGSSPPKDALAPPAGVLDPR